MQLNALCPQRDVCYEAHKLVSTFHENEQIGRNKVFVIMSEAKSNTCLPCKVQCTGMASSQTWQAMVHMAGHGTSTYSLTLLYIKLC